MDVDVRIVDCGYADCGLWIVDCGLWIVDGGWWIWIVDVDVQIVDDVDCGGLCGWIVDVWVVGWMDGR